jgi:hypothetical protein
MHIWIIKEKWKKKNKCVSGVKKKKKKEGGEGEGGESEDTFILTLNSCLVRK